MTPGDGTPAKGQGLSLISKSLQLEDYATSGSRLFRNGSAASSAVPIHHSVASKVPHRRSPEASEQEQENYEKSDLAKAEASHVLRLLRLAPTGDLNHQGKHPFLSGARNKDLSL